MNAKDARKLAERRNKVNPKRVEALVNYASGRIEREAKAGKFELANPFAGLRMTTDSSDVEAAEKRMKAQGFEFHYDEESGHTVSW